MSSNDCGFLNVDFPFLLYICFLSSVYMFVLIIAGIYYPRVDDMLYLLENFSCCFAGGGWVCYSPSHTHLLLHIMSATLYPGLRNLELEGVV